MLWLKIVAYWFGDTSQTYRWHKNLVDNVILCRSIADCLVHGRHVHPETFPRTTVYFGSVPGLEDDIPKTSSAAQVISALNQLHATTIETLAQCNVIKIGSNSGDYLYMVRTYHEALRTV